MKHLLKLVLFGSVMLFAAPVYADGENAFKNSQFSNDVVHIKPFSSYKVEVPGYDIRGNSWVEPGINSVCKSFATVAKTLQVKCEAVSMEEAEYLRTLSSQPSN